jgi:CheY-like chemotaxis protein
MLTHRIKNELQNIKILLISKDIKSNEITGIYTFLKDLTRKVVIEDSYHNVIDKYFNKEHQVHFDLIILNMDLLKVDGFAFVSSIRKIDNNIPYLFINGNNDSNFLRYQEFNKIDYIKQPLSFLNLLTKIYSLVSLNMIERIVNEYTLRKNKEFRDRLKISEHDLDDMIFLIDDFELFISDMICSEDIHKYCDIDLIRLHKLLHHTYNLFYTFANEDIKQTLEPFALSVLSLTNCLNHISCSESIDNMNHVSEILTLLLDDLLKFIIETVEKKEYIYSQYLIDSFISNVSYLETQTGISAPFTDDDTELDFFD